MGHPHHDATATDGQPTNLSPPDWNPPYLPMALLHAPTQKWTMSRLESSKRTITLRPDDDVDGKLFDGELKDLLEHIEARLQGGVLPAWISIDGYCDLSQEIEEMIAVHRDESLTVPERQAKLAEITSDFQDYFFSPEEIWARAFAEMVSFLPYSSVGINYYDGDQKTMFQKFPAAHPVLVACQDLCTLGVLSRGFSYSDLTMIVKEKVTWKDGTEHLVEREYGGISCTANCVTYPAFEGSVIAPPGKAGDGVHSLIPKLLEVTDKAGSPVPPGSILVFNDGGSDYFGQDKGMAHVISVLRVSGGGVQFLETGMDEGPHEFATSSVPFSPLVGVGALGPPKEDLKVLASKIARSRPLGYARLLILDTSTPAPTLRFATKLFHMRHPVSWYVWALRGLPIEHLRVVVHIFVPRGKATTDPLLHDDDLASSPAQLIPEDGHVLAMVGIQGDSRSVHVTRRRQATKQDTWYPDLTIVQPGVTGKAPPAEMAFDTVAKLTTWSGDPDVLGARIELSLATLGKRYVCRPSATTGTFDEGSTGVAHFDP